MGSTLIEVCTYLQATALTLPGMRSAPELPPEKAAAYPFAVTFPYQGDWDGLSGGWMIGLHTLATEIHVARKNLPYDVAKVIGYCETFANALLRDPTLGGHVDTINGGIRYTFGPMNWGGQETIGYRFEINVKVQPALT
jgi:hypothetical protein